MQWPHHVGATHVIAAAAHPLLMAGCSLFGAGGPEIVVTDSVRLPADLPAAAMSNLKVIGISALTLSIA